MEVSVGFIHNTTRKNGGLLYQRMQERKTVILRRLSDNRAEERKFNRWLGNKTVECEHLIKTEVNKTASLAADRHVLAIQDTTELNYESNAGRLKEIGWVGNGSDKGVFLHPTLIVDAETGAGLGFSALHMWNRTEKSPKNYEGIPIEEKESYRWLDCASKTKNRLSQASIITLVSDRESDIYLYLHRIPDQRTHILLRSRGDKILESGVYISKYIDAEPEAGRYSFTVAKEIRRDREKRIATMAVRYKNITIKRPGKMRDKDAPKSIRVNIVSATEVNPPAGVEPITWYLLTTHSVESLNDATQIIKWYQARWQIEQLFRTMKKQGLNVEASQVTEEERIKKLAIVSLSVAIKIMHLVMARDGTTKQKTSDLFSKDEIEFMEVLVKKTEGKTDKQKNPYKNSNLAWASWLIARLGGWKGYKSEGPPGPITMRRGYERFHSMFDGWNLANFVCIG